MRVVSLFATLALAACGPAQFSPDELARLHAQFVTAHNDVRRAVVPAADPALPAMENDNGLAGVAQAWAQGCKFEHSGNGYGENLAFFSGDDSTPADVVGGWAAEAADYDYGANSCADGAQCGHYTQLVWRNTDTLGCGVAHCNVDGYAGLLWVCNYNPAGNVVGQHPY
ncbi:MAG: Fis family transcriptional regulator [Deltaproteobacteria bacterium]|nr:Fis family transcriptional regulator [Deltaproteobacteria bacterium]